MSKRAIDLVKTARRNIQKKRKSMSNRPQTPPPTESLEDKFKRIERERKEARNSAISAKRALRQQHQNNFPENFRSRRSLNTSPNESQFGEMKISDKN